LPIIPIALLSIGNGRNLKSNYHKNDAMKKCILTLILAYFSLNCLANPNGKVLESFKRLCPTAKDVSWSDDGDYYVVHFTTKNETMKIWYSQDAEVVKTLRYYGKDLLLPLVRARVERKYPGKEIFGVTEIGSDGGVQYEIILEDKKRWYHVSSDVYGNSMVTQKFNKS
jgi:hypothetical protein